MTDGQAEKKPQTVFARESTGLVKNVSFLDSISLNFSNMSVGPLLTTIAGSTVATMVLVDVSGLNLVVASAIAFLLSIPQIIVYTMMSRRYPRAGGDYVWLSRTFGGFTGSTLSFWGYTMETLAFIAFVVILLDYAIGGVGASMGFGYGFPTTSWVALFNAPVTSGGSFWQFAVGAIAFTIIIAINMLKPKAGYKFVTVLAVFGAFTLVVAMAVLLAGGHSAMVNYTDCTGAYSGGTNCLGLNGTSSFNTVAASYVPSSGGIDLNWGDMIYILPVMFAFVYPWLNAAPAVASEIKGSRALKWNVPISAVIAFVFATSSFAVLYAVGGIPFINGVFHDVAYQTIGVNFFSLAMGVANNAYVAWLIGLGWIALQFAVIAYAVIIFSRYMLAQSFDRFLPARLSYVSSKYGSPIIAHAVDWVVTVALVGITAYYYGSIAGIFGSIIASMIYFAFVGLAALVHAIRKETGPSKAILAVAGFLNIAVFGFLSYQFLAAPAFTGIDNLTIIYTVGTLLVGALIYLASSRYHKARGMDISLNYKELPPE